MKRFTGLAVAAFGAAGFLASALTVAAGPRELSYATEDAAYQAVMKMATDPRVDIKRIAFVKLMRGSVDVPEYSEIATVFENGLVQAPTEFQFVTHQDHKGEWTEIDRFFDAVNDFGDYDKLTLPRFNTFKMADAFIIAQVLGAENTPAKASVRISLRLIKIDTAERLWAGTVEGIYDDPGPEYEIVNWLARSAIDAAVKNAMGKATTTKLSGYQVFVLPFEGPLGRAMTQAFTRELAIKDPSIQVLHMPNGSASDRMIARFLRDRAGTMREISGSVLKRITTDIGGDRNRPSDKLAVLKGAVTLYEATPTPIKPVRVIIGTEAKTLDINNSFNSVGDFAGIGDVRMPYWKYILDQLQERFSDYRNIVIAIGVLIGLFVVGLIFKQMIRVR